MLFLGKFTKMLVETSLEYLKMSQDAFLLLIQSISFLVAVKRGQMYSKRVLINILINLINLTNKYLYLYQLKCSLLLIYISAFQKKDLEIHPN